MTPKLDPTPQFAFPSPGDKFPRGENGGRLFGTTSDDTYGITINNTNLTNLTHDEVESLVKVLRRTLKSQNRAEPK